jgi:predicted amidohydrolase YtcJ
MGDILAVVILENGTIRTMDASIPVARAVAIASERVAGGVGTHETALASPDRVDLGGRCVMPGFSDAHVHFPSWAAAQREVRLEDSASLDETLQRVAEAAGSVEEGRWLRGRGWRSGDWSPAVEPTRQALDAITGDTPTALMARDYHSLWLNSAALAQADGDLLVDGGVVEVDGDGEPTGVLREESAWLFRDRHLLPSDDEFVDAMREGLRIAASRGVTAVHDKDGWLGAPRFWQRLADEAPLTLRVWQSLPYDFVGRLEELGFRSGSETTGSASAT